MKYSQNVATDGEYDVIYTPYRRIILMIGIILIELRLGNITLYVACTVHHELVLNFCILPDFCLENDEHIVCRKLGQIQITDRLKSPINPQKIIPRT